MGRKSDKDEEISEELLGKQNSNWRGAWPQCRTRLFPWKISRFLQSQAPTEVCMRLESTTDWDTPPYFQMCKRYWHNRAASRSLFKDNPLFLLMLIFSFVCAMKYAWQMLW